MTSALNMDEKEIRHQLQAAGRYLIENDLSWGNAGNLSARLPGAAGKSDLCLITASGTHLGDLAEDDLLACPIDGNLPPNVQRKPSKELPMHTAVYAERPEINAVLHASPFYTTLVACSKVEVPSNLFVEAMYYLERVRRVEYAHPGSLALAEGVRREARRANVLLLENHGVLVCDTSVKEALMGLHTLEIACRMLVTAGNSGIPITGVPEETVRDFLTRSGYRPQRVWPK